MFRRLVTRLAIANGEATIVIEKITQEEAFNVKKVLTSVVPENISRVVRLCCTNGEMDSLFESSGVATVHEQLVPYEVQDQELAFVQHGAEAARFAINLV